MKTPETKEIIKTYSYKWFWMMDYCKKNNFPPAQSWAWNKAELEYNKKHKK